MEIVNFITGLPWWILLAAVLCGVTVVLSSIYDAVGILMAPFTFVVGFLFCICAIEFIQFAFIAIIR